mmetsp:Transcript_5126/g.7827  ORF Transcript_5126/g.7827 Transcript_5126/m.7827 type:complete len:93 (+) Transcript_5126:172-450(+)
MEGGNYPPEQQENLKSYVQDLKKITKQNKRGNASQSRVMGALSSNPNQPMVNVGRQNQLTSNQPQGYHAQTTKHINQNPSQSMINSNFINAT